jgi:hypothetical protein
LTWQAAVQSEPSYLKRYRERATLVENMYVKGTECAPEGNPSDEALLAIEQRCELCHQPFQAGAATDWLAKSPISRIRRLKQHFGLQLGPY